MSTASFQVALTGLIDGYAAEDVAHRLALLFKQPPERMHAILDGKRRVLKKGLSETAARRYVAALEAAGCICVFSEDMPPAAATMSAPASSRSPGAVTAAAPAATAASAPAAAAAAASTAASAAASPTGASAVNAPSPLTPTAVQGSQGRNFYDGARPVGTTAAMAARDGGAAETASAASAEEYRERIKKKSLYEMGAGQKLVIASIMLNGAYAGLNKQFGLLPALIASLAVVAVMITGLLSMCRGLNYKGAKRVLLLLSMFIPLVGLIVMVVLSRKAGNALKEEGVHVGLLGANSDDLAALARDAGLPEGTRPRVAIASIAVLLVFAACFAVSSHYREKAEQAAALAMSRPCELVGVWEISSRLGDFTLTLHEDGRMLSSDNKIGDWRLEGGELLLTEGTVNTSTTHYQILRATDGYVLERMGVAHTMMPKQTLTGKRCKD
ncbi:MAG TPA: hypothetical protein VGF27_07600 [Pseudoduganella sp.]